MSDNFQDAALLQRADAPQLCLPVLSSATPVARSVCSFSAVCSPALSSPWLLPSASSSSLQSLMAGAYVYKYSGKNTLSAFPEQRHICTSADSYAGVSEWDLTGSTDCRLDVLGQFTVPLIDQGITVSCMSVTVHCNQVSEKKTIVPLYPVLSASTDQDTAYQRTSQGHKQSHNYHEGSQLHCYHHNNLEPLCAGDLVSCRQYYGSVSSTGSRASALQPELVTGLKKFQPTDVQPHVYTSASYNQMPAEHSKPLEAYEIPQEHQDPSLLPLATANVPQSLRCWNAESQKQRPVPNNISLGNNSLSMQEQWRLENGVESITDFADINTLVADIHLPHLLKSLTDVPQFQGPILLDGAPPLGNIQHHGPASLGEGKDLKSSSLDNNRPPENTGNHTGGSAQKAASSRSGKADGHRQGKPKRAMENNNRKNKEDKQAGTRDKKEEKPATTQRKRKENPSEFNKENYKKPRTHLGVHMLQSVQVFHALGKKLEKKARLSGFSVVQNTGRTTALRPCRAITPQLDIPHAGKVPEKTKGTAQDPDSTAGKECPIPFQDQQPASGKFKIVPLPFLPLDKPQVRLASRRPLSRAVGTFTTASPARAKNSSAQPPTVNPSQPAPAGTTVMGPQKPPKTISATRPGVRNPTLSSSVHHLAASRPAPYKIPSYKSLQKKPGPGDQSKDREPPKSQSQYILQDFSQQPIPWRKVTIPGPVISHPITTAQRLEREAMKRQAQQEREKIAKDSALRKLKVFLQKEEDMEISHYYGYAM